MSLTAEELALVVDELAPALSSGWIQAIHQPAGDTLVLEIRSPGRTHRLLVCCHPGTARLHLIARKLPNPTSPPPFCRFLRAHIQGTRIEQIRQVPGDRIVELALASHDGPLTLVCALTGKRANVLLMNQDRTVLHALQHPRTLIGQPYRQPDRTDSGRHTRPAVRFSGQAAESGFPVSTAIDAQYRDEETRQAAESAQNARARDLKTAIKKGSRRIEAWQEDLRKAQHYRDYARYGDLLKANLGSIKKGLDRLTLVDYFDAAMPEVMIPLDADKSPQGNMEEYFRKHRKYLSAERELRPRIARAEEDLARLRHELATITQGTWVPPATVPAAARTAAMVGRRSGKQSGSERRGPFRRFTSSDGLPIFVGRNARENDELTFGLAKSDDLWLHARGTPGSHVVVRLEKGKEVPAETLRDAAVLALLYSDLKKSGKGEVIYTRRKWVKKAKGQAPGAVLVTQERSLHTSLDKARLAGLRERAAGET